MSMVSRALSLIIFRSVLLCVILGYQMLAVLFGFQMLPFGNVLIVVVLLGCLNFFYARQLLTNTFKRESLVNFVFFQLGIDIVAVSILVAMTGGSFSGLRFVFLIFILLSALFLDKIRIYVITILSLSFYYLSLNIHLVFFDQFSIQAFNYWSDQIASALASQFVLCFLTALLSVFMQSVYRNGRQILAQREASIEALRNMRRRIVETLPSGLVICNDSGQVSFVNSFGLKLLKRDGEDFSNLNAWDLFQLRPDTALETNDVTTYLARTERELYIRGLRRIFGISYTPLDLEEGEHGYMLVFQDLTKIKMYEAQASLEDRMMAVGKVAAGVAHEIRNPLASISGSVQVLREMMTEEEGAKDLADIVFKETSRLDQIISQFLAYARPIPPSVFHHLSLVALLTNFKTLIENDRDMKRLTWQLELPENSPVYILGDESKLIQVLWNVTRNACNASDDGQTVVLGCYENEENAALYVADQGVGMNETQLAEIYTPFQSFSGKGTGLGMSIVYDIINLHHGRIDVTSAPREGTRVEITFPRHEE